MYNISPFSKYKGGEGGGAGGRSGGEIPTHGPFITNLRCKGVLPFSENVVHKMLANAEQFGPNRSP